MRTCDTSSVRDLCRLVTNAAQTYRRRLIDGGAIEPAGRGKVRFAYQQMRSWLRSQRLRPNGALLLRGEREARAAINGILGKVVAAYLNRNEPKRLSCVL